MHFIALHKRIIVQLLPHTRPVGGLEDEMPRWFDQAEDELVNAVNKGEITEQEFNEQMRDLVDELRAEAQENAHQAYNETFYC